MPNRQSWAQLLAYVESLKDLEPSDRLNKLRQAYEGLTDEPHQGNWVQVRARIRGVINERIGEEGAEAPASWDPNLGRMDNGRKENGEPHVVPPPQTDEEVLPAGLQTPIVGIFMRVKRMDLPTEEAIEELRRLAKIAAGAAVNAILLELLRKYTKGERVNFHTMQEDELEVQRLAAKYPAQQTVDEPPGEHPPDGSSEEDDVSDHEKTNGPDAGSAPPYRNREEYPDDPNLARTRVSLDAGRGRITEQNRDELLSQLDEERDAIESSRKAELEHAEKLSKASSASASAPLAGKRKREDYDPDPDVAWRQVVSDHESGAITSANSKALFAELRKERAGGDGDDDGGKKRNPLLLALGVLGMIAGAVVALVFVVWAIDQILDDDDNGNGVPADESSAQTVGEYAANRYGGQPAFWSRLEPNGFKYSGPETSLRVHEGERIDYPGHTCADPSSSGVYGPETIHNVSIATIWTDLDESSCPSSTRAQSDATNNNGSSSNQSGSGSSNSSSSISNDGQQLVTASWTEADKCEWLRDNFPQTTSGVQQFGAEVANVSPERVRTNIYRCDPKSSESVFDGFIVLGPNEGWSGEVTVDVPDNGAVDAYDPSCGARYTGEHHEVAGGFPDKCDDTWRASSGSVTALSVTYYAWNDDNPPIGGSRSSQDDNEETGDSVCMLGKDLADDRGWIILDNQPESVTKYGGAQVEVKSNDTLPPGWEATTNGVNLAGGDLLTPGFYSVYPPPGDCRSQLGVEG